MDSPLGTILAGVGPLVLCEKTTASTAWSVSGSGAMDLSDPQAVAPAPFSGGREPQPPTWDGSEPIVNFPIFEKNVRYWEFETEVEEAKERSPFTPWVDGRCPCSRGCS